jgi:hypothetical protein
MPRSFPPPNVRIKRWGGSRRPLRDGKTWFLDGRAGRERPARTWGSAPIGVNLSNSQNHPPAEDQRLPTLFQIEVFKCPGRPVSAKRARRLIPGPMPTYRGVIRRNSNLAIANRFCCHDKAFKPPGTSADSSLGEPLQESGVSMAVANWFHASTFKDRNASSMSICNQAAPDSVKSIPRFRSRTMPSFRPHQASQTFF